MFFFRFPQRLFEGHKTTSGPLVVLLLYCNPWWSYKHTTRNCEDFMKVCWSFGFRFNSPRFHTPQFGDDPIIKISTQTEAHCTISSDLGHWWILIFWILGLRVGLYVVDARKCLVLRFGPALLFYCTDFPAPPKNGSFLGKGTKNSLIARLVKLSQISSASASASTSPRGQKSSCGTRIELIVCYQKRQGIVNSKAGHSNWIYDMYKSYKHGCNSSKHGYSNWYTVF